MKLSTMRPRRPLAGPRPGPAAISIRPEAPGDRLSRDALVPTVTARRVAMPPSAPNGTLKISLQIFPRRCARLNIAARHQGFPQGP